MGLMRVYKVRWVLHPEKKALPADILVFTSIFDSLLKSECVTPRKKALFQQSLVFTRVFAIGVHFGVCTPGRKTLF